MNRRARVWLRCIVWQALVFAGALGAQAQSSLPTAIDALRASRANLPSFAGKYEEQVTVPNSPRSVQPRMSGQPIQLSWGDRDSQMFYISAVGPAADYRWRLGDGKNSLWDHQELFVTGKTYESASNGKQGYFYTKRTTGHYNPASLGYELTIGNSIDSLLSSPGALLGADGSLTAIDHGLTYTAFPVVKDNQTVVERWDCQGGGADLAATITSWIKYRSHFFPSVARLELRKNGSLIQSIDYKLVKVLPDPERYLAWHGWNEGGIVTDGDTQHHYLVRNGQLTESALLNQNSRTQLTLVRGAIIGCFVMLAMYLLFRLETTWRRRRQASVA
jgi:hypothetical protein